MPKDFIMKVSKGRIFLEPVRRNVKKKKSQTRNKQKSHPVLGLNVSGGSK